MQSTQYGDYLPEQVRDALIRLWQDPIAFGVALGYKGDPPTEEGGPRRKQFGEFHYRMMSHVHSGPRTSTIIPRGHAKSTLITVIDTAHTLLRDPTSRNLLASATLDLSKKLTGEIRDRLSGDVELLPGLFFPVSDIFPWISPGARPTSRTLAGPTDHFNIVGRSGKGREPSVFAASVDSNLAGNHPTRAVIDDPANEQNSRTFARRQKVIEFIDALEPLMYSADSPIRHVGTPWAFDDITAHLGRRPDWRQFRFGVWDGPNKALTDERAPLCPSFLNEAEIEAKRENLPKTFFAAQYLCQPIPSEEALFEPQLVEAATDSQYETPSDLPDGPELLLFDPVARVDGAKGDLNGLLVVRLLTASALGLKGFEPDRNIFVPVRAHEIAGGADAAACWIEDICIPQHPLIKSIWIEQVAAQALFAPWLEERGRIKGVKIRGQKIGTRGLLFRLMGLQTAMRKGYLVLPRNFPGKDLLTRRLTEYPLGDSDDLISALALLSTMTERRGPLPGMPQPDLEPYPTAIWKTTSNQDNWPG